MTEIGSMLSDTLVKVILVAVVGGAMVLVWRRWHDGVFLAVAVIVEATVFLFSSLVVGRDRPPVEPLDDPAPSGSFPSGHTAAAVAFYAGLFIVVSWHTRNRGVRLLFAAVAVVAPLIVGFSRVQRGMHHPIDVVAGIALGVASLFVVRAALARGVAEIDEVLGDRAPPQVRALDLTSGGRS
jgi:undecaprenyl-diphosphatase